MLKPENMIMRYKDPINFKKCDASLYLVQQGCYTEDADPIFCVYLSFDNKAMNPHNFATWSYWTVGIIEQDRFMTDKELLEAAIELGNELHHFLYKLYTGEEQCRYLPLHREITSLKLTLIDLFFVMPQIRIRMSKVTEKILVTLFANYV